MAFEIIGDYKVDLKSFVGQGTFGYVMKAEHRRTKVPAKRIPLGKPGDDNKYLVREIKALSAVSNHEHIVCLLHWQAKDNFLWLVMDFCDGGDIDEYLTKNSIDEQQKHGFIKQIVEAVHYMHTLKPKAVIHRDLKAGNILVTLTRDGPILKVS